MKSNIKWVNHGDNTLIGKLGVFELVSIYIRNEQRCIMELITYSRPVSSESFFEGTLEECKQKVYELL